jgi:hypothetical protein
MTPKPVIPVAQIIANLGNFPSSPEETQVMSVPSKSSGSYFKNLDLPSPNTPSIAADSEADSSTATSSTVSSSAEGNFWFSAKDKEKDTVNEKGKVNANAKERENKTKGRTHITGK